MNYVEAFKPGDKIIANEPYHYGGKSKMNPDVPGIIDFLYCHDEMISYLRDNALGNGNMAIEYKEFRHATTEDLQRYSVEFALLEGRFKASAVVAHA